MFVFVVVSPVAVQVTVNVEVVDAPAESCVGVPEITPEVLPHLHSRMIYDPPLQKGRWGVEPCNEIDRAEMDSPVIVNVTVPHRPVSGHDNERILICHRFTPELTAEEVLRICNL